MITADLKDKRALVTGGASGIGLATVKALLRCGAKVAVNHRPGNKMAAGVVAELAKSHPGRVIAAPGDVASAGDAVRMTQAAITALGGLDILINNAGTPVTKEPIPHADIEAMTEEFWSTILETNLKGPFRCIKTAYPALKAARGCVINTASVAGLGGVGSSLAYAASKAALMNMTHNLGKALGPHVRVNAIAPGLVKTPWTDPWPAERKARAIEVSPIRRLIESEDIADTMIFLAAQTAITGQTIVVDGGRLL